jgi:hypothetical protein
LRVADRQHADDASAFDHRHVTEVVASHQLLGFVHGVVRRAAHHPRGHDVVHAQVRQFAPFGGGEDAHEIALGNDADHADAGLADGQGADAVRVHGLGRGLKRIGGQTRHQALTCLLEKLTNLHGGFPRFLDFSL